MKKVNSFLFFSAMIFMLGCTSGRCYDSARSTLALIQSMVDIHDSMDECYAQKESCDKTALHYQLIKAEMVRHQAEENAKLCLGLASETPTIKTPTVEIYPFVGIP